MRVLIVGGGIGGLALGAFLKECGIGFEIVERSKEWGKQGFSLGMWDNGRDILNKLGLADKFDIEGERIKDYFIYNGKGKLLKHYNLQEFYAAYGAAYTHLNRSKLHEWLLNKTGRDKVAMATSVASIKETTTGVKATLTNGEARVYDVIVGADGVHSIVRKLAFSSRALEHYTEWRAWFFWTDSSFKKPQCIFQYTGGTTLISLFDDKDKALCVALSRAKHGEWDAPEQRLEHLKLCFKECPALFPKILEHVQARDIVPTDIAVVRMKCWHTGRVVLLGDAAHAMEPYAGLGASMAMEDAYVLAGELLKVSSAYSLEQALETYEEVRKKRVNRAIHASMGLHRWLLTKSRLLNKLLALFVPYVPVRLFTKQFHELLREEI